MCKFSDWPSQLYLTNKCRNKTLYKLKKEENFAD